MIPKREKRFSEWMMHSSGGDSQVGSELPGLNEYQRDAGKRVRRMLDQR
jgi:hypothetical protein